VSKVGVTLALGGIAKVYCVHDREKRQVRSPDDAFMLARMAGLLVDPHSKFQTCGCCENVFATPDDTPRLCERCSLHHIHALGGPLELPIEGVID